MRYNTGVGDLYKMLAELLDGANEAGVRSGIEGDYSFVSRAMNSHQTTLERAYTTYQTFRNMQTIRSYDKDSNDAMIRVVEPNVYSLIKTMELIGVNTTWMPKLRKSMPSPSRLIKAYSKYCEFKPYAYLPSAYRVLVHEPKEPIDFERAYFLYAIKYCNDDVEEAKKKVHEYMLDNWGYRRVKNQATRDKPKFSYILNECLNEQEFEFWCRNGRDVNRMLKSNAHRWERIKDNIAKDEDHVRIIITGLLYAWTSAMLEFLNDLKSGRYVYEGKDKT